jgi:hypothetical protein
MSQTTRKLFLNTARAQQAMNILMDILLRLRGRSQRDIFTDILAAFFFIEFTTAMWKLEEETTRSEPDRRIGTGSPPWWGGGLSASSRLRARLHAVRAPCERTMHEHAAVCHRRKQKLEEHSVAAMHAADV